MKIRNLVFRDLIITLMFLTFMPLTSCGAGGNQPEAPMVSEAVVQAVSQKQIYFAHQSVGYNILDGVLALTGEKLDIRELKDGIDWSVPVFAHAPVGENTQPLSKVDDFQRQLATGIGAQADIAFMKFCYVDFNAETDAKVVFKAYDEAVRSLEASYPELKLVHLTVPLMTQQTGIKAVIKRILGRDVYGERENLKRQEFNKLVRSSYGRVFDLAQIEATRPDGTLNEHVLEGEMYYSLVPDYTYDGGHLNETGAKLAARELLNFLADLK